jgi:hypothetical protein
MQILFIANDEPDYLQDIVFHGLVSILGAEAVIDCPPVARYRHPPPPGVAFPMLWLGLPPRPHVTVAEALDAADAIVIGSLRPGSIAAAREALDAAAGRPVAFLDGEDDPYIRGIARSVDLYFKRETLLSDPVRVASMPLRRLQDRVRPEIWPRDPLARRVAVATKRSRRVVPLPFAIIDVGFEPSEPPEMDVTFLGSPTNSQRPDLIRALGALRAEGLRVRVPGQGRLPWHEYLRALSRSRIAISLPGNGFDTYRYWEIPYSGSLLLGAVPQIVIPDNFEDGREAFFAPARALADRARVLLGAETATVAAAGRAKLLRAHTSARRAETVLTHIEARLLRR